MLVTAVGGVPAAPAGAPITSPPPHPAVNGGTSTSWSSTATTSTSGTAPPASDCGRPAPPGAAPAARTARSPKECW
ncbi:hypothetical protein NKG94_24890 [Micromonospora sp. M12]